MSQEQEFLFIRIGEETCLICFPTNELAMLSESFEEAMITLDLYGDEMGAYPPFIAYHWK